MPLTRTYIKNFCEDVQTYFKGADYYAAGRVHLIDDKITSDGHRIVKAGVHGSENMRYKTTIVLTADGSALESAECNCPAFHFSEGICKHIVALSIRAGNDVPPKPEPIKTDYAALVLLREYAKKTILEASTTATGVRLVPTLIIDSRVPALAFKIGFDRLYVVKDLCQLVRDVKLGENRSYGKQCSFFHCLGAFAPKSAKLMAFLLRYYDRRIEMYDDDCYYSSSEKYRKMNLLPFMLDSFFELFQGEELAVEISRRVFPYEIKTENPHLQLHIDQRKNGAYSLGLSKPFRLLQGDSCLYPLIDDVIYRCDPEFSSAVGGLFRALPEDSRQKLTIAENEMPSLAATLLPTVRPYLSIISASDLTVFQPAALCSKVFFDMPAPERVTARLEHHYAENAHMGFSDKDLRKSLDLRGESKIENLMYRYFQSSTVPGEVFIENNEKALYDLAEHGIAEISELAEIFATD
ncbi:MAG: SNF2 helicase associated domain-containing protein, partial [Oscillospiraceae bacterium]